MSFRLQNSLLLKVLMIKPSPDITNKSGMGNDDTSPSYKAVKFLKQCKNVWKKSFSTPELLDF